MAFTITRAMAGVKETGEPLPVISELYELYQKGIEFRRSQVICIAGMPGSQKSGFATWLALKWGVPTMYMSADMDPFTATTRVAGLLTDRTSKQAAVALNSGGPEADEIGRLAADLKLRFVFDSQPSLDDIDDELYAWVEIYDEYPTLIVVDNLLDMEPLSEVPHESDKGILLELKELARRTNSLVLVLAHNKEGTDPSVPAPAKALQGKVSQPLALLLSIALASNGQEVMPFRFCAVKNRTGPADPSGRDYVEIFAEPAKTKFMPRNIYAPTSSYRPRPD